MLLVILLCLALGCHSYSKYAGRHRPDAEILEPFAAMYEIDRDKYCLTEIEPDSVVHVEEDMFATSGYDVMLHFEGDRLYRTVAFVFEDGKYVWIGEQVSYRSGRTYELPGKEGEQFNEIIWLTYTERPHAGSPEVGLRISYWGPYEDISAHPTCEEALQVISEWRARDMNADD